MASPLSLEREVTPHITSYLDEDGVGFLLSLRHSGHQREGHPEGALQAHLRRHAPLPLGHQERGQLPRVGLQVPVLEAVKWSDVGQLPLPHQQGPLLRVHLL